MPKLKVKEKNALYQYGNYCRYYGYRNPDNEDNRLKVLAERTDLFYGKDVLDIGCNIGHVTFSIARDFSAKSVVGMDIDRKLVNIARKNVQHYINDTGQSSSHLTPKKDFDLKNRNDSNCDNVTELLPLQHRSIKSVSNTFHEQFPFNVSFVQGNYVLESDLLLSLETCKFDVILCLSITKWLHLNWGDDGLKRAFKRMFAQLRPGGILVMEPQPWKSYGRRKTLTETISQNYKNILLKPPMFTDYLLNEVGFANCETLTMPHNPSKGFQRPLKLYRKPDILVTS
ncbi:7SK snRNA methylphosphate capping enzyme [Acyrthosiphon pisum]|uniref:RNA methyltransferase n=1 Tax=Acyrthosiphon pisum TaxID=7029 RepID=A0A8R1W329_ACYPI|nr:7SK snRNA methylphosphate capping enzyme [Acyrthosiphon pisum]|eukprot:XP_001942870.1 PREDICTED: 7SK snRNA methylphosphate capping enzyme [Acyrthosiphon pisum]